MQAQVTAAQIARSLATDVHNGGLKAGDMYPSERELCENHGVGRNVVREAFTILQGMRLADQARGKRPRVVTPSLGQVLAGLGDAAQFFFMGSEGKAHLEQARLFLETSVLRYAVANITNAQMARMLSAIEDCDANLGEPSGFLNADVTFHRVLAEVPGNPIFVALHEAFVERLMTNRPILENFQERNEASCAEHKEIVRSMLDKDADGAVDVLTRHLTRNYSSHFRQTLDRQVSNPPHTCQDHPSGEGNP